MSATLGATPVFERTENIRRLKPDNPRQTDLQLPNSSYPGGARISTGGLAPPMPFYFHEAHFFFKMKRIKCLITNWDS